MNKDKQKKSFEFKGFINYYLTDDEMRYVKTRNFTDEDFVGKVLALTSDGYKITLNFDAYNECFQATLTAVSTGNSNDGFAVSGRGSDAVKAFKQLLYIHFEVCEGDWTVIQNKAQRWKNIDD